jgi:signal transduction histidine kinase
VFGNLLHNAIKYSPAGESVRVTVRTEQRWAMVSVTDCGPGIAPEDRPLLFQRYGQLKGRMRSDSTGLGLYIVKTITEAHGGTVDVDSAPGLGATFTVCLPCAGTGLR